MKLWQTPSLNELNVNATSYHPENGTRIDGAYTSTDGKYHYDTYGPSSGDAGTPGLNGNDPSANDGDDFVAVH